MQSINLIPQEEQKEQRKEKIVKFSSVLSILLLMIVVGASGYVWFRKNSINNEIAQTEANIQKNRNDISSLSEMEVVARDLDAKYSLLNNFFSNKRHYSVLLDELKKRVPVGTVFIDTFALTGENKQTINLSGAGIDYISIARFIDTLSNKEFAQASEGYKNLFQSVTLNSVNLDNQDSSVNYFIVTEYSTDLIQ